MRVMSSPMLPRYLPHSRMNLLPMSIREASSERPSAPLTFVRSCRSYTMTVLTTLKRTRRYPEWIYVPYPLTRSRRALPHDCDL